MRLCSLAHVWPVALHTAVHAGPNLHTFARAMESENHLIISCVTIVPAGQTPSGNAILSFA